MPDMAIISALSAVAGTIVALFVFVLALLNTATKAAAERGRHEERLDNLRREFDAEKLYIHDNVHDLRDAINERLAEIDVKLARHGINGIHKPTQAG